MPQIYPREIAQVSLRNHMSGAPPLPKTVLRLSVTERCNFACLYCMPPGGIPKTVHKALPSLSQLLTAVGWLIREQNVNRIKITGGEPLLRPGLVDLVKELARLPGIGDLSLTTNGSRLRYMAADLRNAGLNRVNVSLDTLNPDEFYRLTHGRLEQVLAGIEAALTAGLKPMKLNAVLRRSRWREDVPELIGYAARMGLDVRFIELMKTGAAAEWASAEFVSAVEVRNWLGRQAALSDLPGDESAPARSTKVDWKGSPVKVGWITALSQPFCDHCHRLRLDCHGRLRRCLMDPVWLPLLEMLKAYPEAEVRSATEEYLQLKRAPQFMGSEQVMASVGG